MIKKIIHKMFKSFPAELDIKEAAKLLNVDARTILNAIIDKHLRARKIENHWFIQRKDLIKYLLFGHRRLKDIIERFESYQKEWVTLEETACIFSLSYVTVYRWVCIYSLFSCVIKFNGRILIFRESLLSFIVENPGKIFYSYSKQIFTNY